MRKMGCNRVFMAGKLLYLGTLAQVLGEDGARVRLLGEFGLIDDDAPPVQHLGSGSFQPSQDLQELGVGVTG